MLKPCRRLMLGPMGVSATDRQVEFLPSSESPGYATIMGGSNTGGVARVTIDEAERLKINHERKLSALEIIEEMPPTKYLERKLCRACHYFARHKCSSCWTWYCSKTCQRRDWKSHVFVCRVPGRPNDVDFLRLAISRVKKEVVSDDEERIQNAMLYLFADDHICRSFGFINCTDVPEVLSLICLYSTIFPRIPSVVKALQEHLEAGNLGELMEEFCRLERCVAQVTEKDECVCVTWFLERHSSEPLLMPNMEAQVYDIWFCAFNGAAEQLNLIQRIKSEDVFSRSENDVFKLYIAIWPTLWRFPDVYSSAWINFGFCHCRSFTQKAKLARIYLALAFSAATFDDIVSAYETGGLANLMRIHSIDVSELERQGIRLHRPPPCEYSVYRLMLGVEHALSGCFCPCFRPPHGSNCHHDLETHIDHESDTNFGFHLTRPWERWQLLNFYKHLFKLPGFDPRRMAEATEDSNLESLENYLDTLVPNMRKKIFDINRANLLFPRLKDRIRFSTVDGQSVPHHHIECDCKLHDVVGPPGLSNVTWYQILGAA